MESLTKTLGRTPVLDGVSFEVPAGSIVAVLGPNGAGKTTLLRCLTGILLPSSGRVLYDGRPFDREDLPLRRRIAYLPDVSPADPSLTVLEHCGLVLRLYEVPERGLVERVLALLRRFDMLPCAPLPISTLSRGQSFKAALIPLLAAQPELLIVDEPFASGMDPAGLLGFKELAHQIAARGGTVVYTTQITEVVERFSTQVCVLHRGRLEGCGPIESLAAGEGRPGDLEALFARLREQA